MNKQQELTLINQRIETLFNVSKFNTQFWSVIVNDIYDHSYNIFFSEQRQGQRERSIPIHTLEKYTLTDLEEIVRGLQQRWKFTIKFIQFKNQLWPTSQKVIQKKSRRDE
ncbi:acetyl-CoA carboxylase [Pediococcus pentosaceus]|uniref:acetyl-CoA carboxylase n=1 Tax=Pediococcus pentosaceus TaxID=1255 RepID=UPI00223BBCE4|nr:acetyl-CoA carboxylase [Pediococcus pentosaceus]MCT1176013.1 acetyl-CoA carboxylase [Pediococcus pentosaceus]